MESSYGNIDIFGALEMINAFGAECENEEGAAQAAPDLNGVKAALHDIPPKYRRMFEITIKFIEIDVMLKEFEADLQAKTAPYKNLLLLSKTFSGGVE